MEGESEFRPWDDLISDTLGSIFDRLSLEEALTVIPLVCKSWNKTVSEPYCWQEIDIEEWSEGVHTDYIDKMLRMLILRSAGSVRKISVSALGDDSIFAFIAEHGGSLQTLRVPTSYFTDSIVVQVAGQLSNLTFLDLSYCDKLGPIALEAIGKNCKQLTTLCRNMHLFPECGISRLDQNNEALVIADTMPKLKRLEIAYHLVNTENLIKILMNCPDLEFMDLSGCWDVHLDEKYLKETFPKLKILSPPYDMMDEWDICSDDLSDTGEYYPWEALVGEMVDSDDEIYDGVLDGDEVELRFYDGSEDSGAYVWPPSP
ncbi:hypothetical protein ACFE04_012176 [Oxalis oulophora]